ncbi:unnamed protein product [Paramecium octaurelia]|uniref:Uncharacterized protein n=1 Tax=Paramecium octaurelia TaxID=43137 RepID=A0A8S1TZF4_PAROT|nr:unnamed protein product [Paramecium octaurelia]
MYVDLKSHDFKKIRIRDTSLIGGNFAKCNLSLSEFNNVNINGININRAIMIGCIWRDLKINELHTLDGHSDNVSTICYSPDSTTLAFGSEDNSIRLWDVKTGEEKAKLDGHEFASRR